MLFFMYLFFFLLQSEFQRIVNTVSGTPCAHTPKKRGGGRNNKFSYEDLAIQRGNTANSEESECPVYVIHLELLLDSSSSWT